MAEVGKSICVDLDPELLDEIESYCAVHGCTLSRFMNMAAELFLNQCREDEADYDAAVAAWTEHERHGGRTYTSEEIRKMIGL